MDILMDTLKDKEKLLQFLLHSITESQKQTTGISKLRESLNRENPNHSQANLIHCLNTSMNIIAKQSNIIQNLAIISLIQVQSSRFDTDVAMMLNKMGRGNEALQQMFKNKFKS